MHALIMAGGSGTRLAMGEKPLVLVCGRPMIAFVIDAFAGCGIEVLVVTSPRTPMTSNWCRSNGIPAYAAAGRGYVEDLVEAAGVLGAEGPLFSCVADLPCISEGIIREIQRRWKGSGMEACSVWVPLALCEQHHCTPRYTEELDGQQVCPAGINILHGSRIASEQEELPLVLPERRLVFNVNTREERERVESYLCPGS
ncbi:MAG: NTP transferase domain-containing protein [Methanomicrobiaceae archaeon]|nr:NTP transferase domain-containing protein [Methanomicrobiaceae archaeon]